MKKFYILLLVIFIILFVYLFKIPENEDFTVFNDIDSDRYTYSCYGKGERDCRFSPDCEWVIDDDYNGTCQPQSSSWWGPLWAGTWYDWYDNYWTPWRWNSGWWGDGGNGGWWGGHRRWWNKNRGHGRWDGRGGRGGGRRFDGSGRGGGRDMIRGRSGVIGGGNRPLNVIRARSLSSGGGRPISIRSGGGRMGGGGGRIGGGGRGGGGGRR